FENAGAIVRQTYNMTASAKVTDDSTTLVANLDLTAMYPNTGISWTRKLTYSRHATLTVSDACTVPAGVIPYFQLQLPVQPTVTAEPAGLPDDLRKEFHQIVDRFEAAWWQGPRPDIAQFLPDNDRLRLAVLRELVLVDLENRCKCGEKPQADEFLAAYPELNS